MGSEQAIEMFDQSRLPGPISSDQSNRLSPEKLEMNISQNGKAVIAETDILGLNDWRRWLRK
jgi:hypothetical protein